MCRHWRWYKCSLQNGSSGKTAAAGRFVENVACPFSCLSWELVAGRVASRLELTCGRQHISMQSCEHRSFVAF